MAAEAKIRMRYHQVKGELTERARRLFVASEAMAFGYGGIAAALRATGMAASVIGRGIAEVRAIEGGAVPALPVRCRNFVTPPGRTREPHHRDGRDAGHEPRPTPSPAATVGVSGRVD
jgi:hypothetical protein